MATVSLSATPRTDFGKGAARKIRAQGLLPAVIYRAGQPATSIVLDPLALETAFRRSGNRNTLVDLGVDGSNYVCLVKETQRDPVSAVLLHVDERDEQIEVAVARQQRRPEEVRPLRVGVEALGRRTAL